MSKDRKKSGTSTDRKRGSGVGHVYAVLREEILDLTLAPGSPVDEMGLAERFGMSRTPIREALVRLASDGLVVTLPNRSTMVSPVDLLNLGSYFDAITLMYRVTARLAARNHRKPDLQRLHAVQADYVKAAEKEDALAMIAVNREFHLAVAEAARNHYYTSMMGRLLDDGRRLLRLYYQSFDDRLPMRYAQEHETLLEAIANRDMDAADAIARAHADQIVEHIRSLLAPDHRDAIDLAPDGDKVRA